MCRPRLRPTILCKSPAAVVAPEADAPARARAFCDRSYSRRAARRLLLANQDDRPRRSRRRNESYDVEVHPIGDEPEEADDRFRYPVQLFRDRDRRIERLGEVGHVDAVGNVVRVRVQRTALHTKLFRRSEHQVGATDELSLHADERLSRHAGERGILIDAMIDDQSLVQAADLMRQIRQERPQDRLPETVTAAQTPQTGGEEPRVQPIGDAGCGQRKHERIGHPEIPLDFPTPFERASQLVDDATHVACGRRRSAHADRVDPQDAVPLGKDPHDVGLAGRITAPVVGEADDGRAVEHGFSHAPASPAMPVGRSRTGSASRRSR